MSEGTDCAFATLAPGGDEFEAV